MIRFAFTPSTIRRSFDALFRDKTSGSQNGKRASYNFVKMGIAFGVILAILFGVNFVAASLKRSNWQNSAKRRAGARQTLKIGRAKYGFVWIPAGEFDMGSPESEKDRGEAERLHRASLTKGFWMLETEVPQKLYKEIAGENPSGFKGKNLPVEKVSWDDATEFCSKLTSRLPAGLKATLPTETQWEYACRAGTTTPYSFGSALNGDKANCDGAKPYGTTTKRKPLGRTVSVKRYRKNPWGLYNMHGNVWEWTADYDGDYPTGTAFDPQGPAFGSNRVERGGAFNCAAYACRSAARGQAPASDRYVNLGFRFILICD